MCLRICAVSPDLPPPPHTASQYCLNNFGRADGVLGSVILCTQLLEGRQNLSIALSFFFFFVLLTSPHVPQHSKILHRYQVKKSLSN